jgi:hypothetical protein
VILSEFPVSEKCRVHEWRVVVGRNEMLLLPPPSFPFFLDDAVASRLRPTQARRILLLPIASTAHPPPPAVHSRQNSSNSHLPVSISLISAWND